GANSSLSDLETEFAEVFSTITIDENAAKTDAQSEADKAFEDIFRESATTYLPDGAIAAGAALGMAGAAAASYGRASGYNQPVASAKGADSSGSSDDFYNHWAAQGAQ